MSHSVLAIGLCPDLGPIPTQFLRVDSIPAAEQLLQQQEIGTIVLDARNSSTLDTDIQRLLAATAVTTRFILISSKTVSGSDYPGLGIEILSPPKEPDQWQELVSLVSNG